MNTIINDLGMEGKRHFYEVKCYDCNSTIKVRSDRLHKECRCKDCQLRQRTIKAKESADKMTDLKATKVCTCCGLEKHIYDFHKKDAQYSGHRAVCKACRYFNERNKNSDYLKSEAGRLVSVNAQGKRRELIYATKDHSITTTALKELKEKQNHSCAYCKSDLDYSSPNQVHLDHVIPLSKGGTHTIENVVWSCRSCNSAKGNNLLES